MSWDSAPESYRVRGLPRSPAGLALAAAAALSVLYVSWSPRAPDLAAQVARAGLVRRAGFIWWWTGWFGGLSMPTYSVITPALMAWLGVEAAGVLAVLAGAVASARLVEGMRRPRLGAISFAVAQVADLFAGRVTFVIGLAVAAWALVALRRNMLLVTPLLAWLSYLASPLAGLFLSIVLVGVAVLYPPMRRTAAVAAGSVLLLAVGMAVLVPGTGTMPFALRDAGLALGYCAVVALVCPSRLIRLTAALVALATIALVIAPGAVGNNITRLCWVCAVPLVVTCSPLRPRALLAVLVLLGLWPVGDLAIQLSSAHGASTKPSYYAPLAEQLTREATLPGAPPMGSRVEVVDTVNHWGSAYLPTFPLARGWDRQADVADNPIFYQPGLLTVDSYDAWLHELAVGWVALPAAPLDYAAVQEAAVIRSGPSYLQLVWANPQWRLYRVKDPSPFVVGAEVAAVQPDGVTLVTTGAATVSLRLRWSPYLTVVDPASGTPIPSCVSDVDGWVQLVLPEAGTVEVTSRVDPTHRLSPTALSCTAAGAVG